MADVCPKVDPPPLAASGMRSFIDKVGEYYVQKQQPALTVIFGMVISGLTSTILVVLGTVNLQFQDPFVSISLRPVLGIAAAYVMDTVWSSRS